MSRYLLLGASLATFVIATASFAATPAEQQRACISEAKRPVTQSAAYRNGSARNREVLSNAYTPGVTAALKVCRARAAG